MLPDWFTKPESEFRTLLFLTSPVWGYYVVKGLKRLESWNASITEGAAKSRVAYLRKELDNPPTLIGSLGYIVCFLPLPIALTALIMTLSFWPFPSPRLAPAVDPAVGAKILHGSLGSVFFINYVIFGTLAVHGVKVAYRLRHGEAQYAANFKAETQKQIDKLKKKFPNI
jgi:hypothetical protein